MAAFLALKWLPRRRESSLGWLRGAGGREGGVGRVWGAYMASLQRRRAQSAEVGPCTGAVTRARARLIRKRPTLSNSVFGGVTIECAEVI